MDVLLAKPRSLARFSLRSLMSAHSGAAAICAFAVDAPIAASVIGAVAVFFLVQMAVLAVCTRRMTGWTR